MWRAQRQNGRLLLTFAADNKLTILNSFFDKRKGGIWHRLRSTVHQGKRRSASTTSSLANHTAAECPAWQLSPNRSAQSSRGLRPQHGDGHRRPQRPIRSQPRAVRTNPKQKQFDRRALQAEDARWAVTERFIRNLHGREQPATTTQKKTRAFTDALIDAARMELPEELRRRREQE